MINAEDIRDIIAIYERYGWTLRRVLLTPALRSSIDTNVTEIVGRAVVSGSELDAAWFSRSSIPGKTAWELRHLAPLPYALVGVIDDDEDIDTLAEMISGIEDKMVTNLRFRDPERRSDQI